MVLNIYNTLSKKKEEFVPIVPGKVSMYVCGITAYDSCHLGHARAAVVFDAIVKYLRYLGYDVKYARNYTDIDDKIINRANKEGISCKEISERYIAEYEKDMKTLGVSNPDIRPKATEHIPEMIEAVKKLIERGLAYEINGDVYFSVRKFSGYGKLSGKNIEELESGARVEVNETKKDPLDFALWKASKPGEPKWPSPWGDGRPGWHIECSVMSSKYLGQPFDIHGGGRDLVFPHHENEIAQAEGVCGCRFANYWIHNGFININAEKMSKSLCNFKTICEVTKNFEKEVVRFFLLSNHYRSPIDYTEDNIKNAERAVCGFYSSLEPIAGVVKNNKVVIPACPAKRGGAGIQRNQSDYEKELAEKINNLKTKFESSMNDDFNTALAVGAVFDLVKEVNSYVTDKKKVSHPDARTKICAEFVDILKNTFGNVLGFFGSSPDDFCEYQKKIGIVRCNLDVSKIEDLIVKRREARQNKDFAKADEIRKELGAMGVELKDAPDGVTRWNVKI